MQLRPASVRQHGAERVPGEPLARLCHGCAPIYQLHKRQQLACRPAHLRHQCYPMPERSASPGGLAGVCKPLCACSARPCTLVPRTASLAAPVLSTAWVPGLGARPQARGAAQCPRTGSTPSRTSGQRWTATWRPSASPTLRRWGLPPPRARLLWRAWPAASALPLIQKGCSEHSGALRCRKRLCLRQLLRCRPSRQPATRLLAVHPQAPARAPPRQATPEPLRACVAQAELGDIVYVEMPEVGSQMESGAVFGVVESVKARRSASVGRCLFDKRAAGRSAATYSNGQPALVPYAAPGLAGAQSAAGRPHCRVHVRRPPHGRVPVTLCSRALPKGWPPGQARAHAP